VVLAVATLYHALAPLAEALRMAKPLVRIAHNPPEIQYVALANIATLATQRPVRSCVGLLFSFVFGVCGLLLALCRSFRFGSRL
jgi:hypothetical protein